MQLPKVVEIQGIRVLTSKQLATEYGASTQHIAPEQSGAYIQKKYFLTFV